MRRDVKSNYSVTTSIASNLATPATLNGVGLDVSLGLSASFYIDVGAITGTVDAKLQYSDDNSTWTDEDGLSGNSTAITQLTATGNAQLDVVRAQEKYYRVVAVVAGTSAQICVMAIAGPLKTIPAE